MKLLCLGTAAAEGMPATFCNCKVCAQARKLGGKNFRARTQMLINDDLLIDFGPDTYMSAQKFGVDLSAIKHLLITHTHQDHYLPFELAYRDQGCAKDMKEPVVTLYGNDGLKRVFPEYFSLEKQERFGVRFQELTVFERTRVGEYTVTPLKADHMTSEQAFIYLIEYKGKNMLYCNDTGRICQENKDFLAKLEKPLDLVSFDCTYGIVEAGKWNGHMSFYDDVVLFDELKVLGAVTEKTKAVVTHFSHWNMLMHDEMQRLADEYGFIVAYDGLTIEI